MRLSAPIHQLKRRAKLLARNENIALHKALDRIAREEGFAAWSLLSARGVAGPDMRILPQLAEGDLLLLAARPGHGKTLLGLRLLLDAAREGRRSVFFSLEYTEREVRERITALGDTSSGGDVLELVTSDDISSDVVMEHLADAPRGTVAVIDYLQILDQRRDKPELAAQINALKNFAQASGTILAFISQVDRSFDPGAKPVPDISDIRLPNRIDLGVFSKACFLHEGRVQFQSVA